MKVANKEEKGLNITCFLDRKNYLKFLSDLKKMGQKYETKSNPNNLNYAGVFYGRRMPYINVKGWSSKIIEKDKGIHHVMFLDYDEMLFEEMKEELEYVCRKHNMSPFYVFKTFETIDGQNQVYGNYIAISLTKKRFAEVVDIQNELHCDAAYKKVPLIYRFKCWVLRLGNKGKKSAPKFKCVVGNNKKSYNQEISQAHLEVLRKLYPEIPLIKYTKKDGNKKLYLSEYQTASL